MLLNAWKSVAVGRGEQVACLLLSTVPLAENRDDCLKAYSNATGEGDRGRRILKWL